MRNYLYFCGVEGEKKNKNVSTEDDLKDERSNCNGYVYGVDFLTDRKH